MGRGRTTTGMVAASLIATIEAGRVEVDGSEDEEVWDENGGVGSEEAQYLNGQFPADLHHLRTVQTMDKADFLRRVQDYSAIGYCSPTWQT